MSAFSSPKPLSFSMTPTRRTDMGRFAKAWAALSALVLLVVGQELGQDSKWYAYAVGVLAVIAVYVVPNKPSEPTGGDL